MKDRESGSFGQRRAGFTGVGPQRPPTQTAERGGSGKVGQGGTNPRLAAEAADELFREVIAFSRAALAGLQDVSPSTALRLSMRLVGELLGLRPTVLSTVTCRDTLEVLFVSPALSNALDIRAKHVSDLAERFHEPS
eukprot:gene27529-35534_t